MRGTLREEVGSAFAAKGVVWSLSGAKPEVVSAVRWTSPECCCPIEGDGTLKLTC